MPNPKLLVFAGSARADSFNKKLAKIAASIAEKCGATVTFADLADYPAAIFNEDDETANGVPQTMRDFKTLMQQHDGFIIVSPEYNGCIPPLLSNTFSWASRQEGGEKSMIAFSSKKAALMATSPGRLGGIRVLPRLRDSLGDLGVMVVPGFVSVPLAGEVFKDDVLDDKQINIIQKHVTQLIDACG